MARHNKQQRKRPGEVLGIGSLTPSSTTGEAIADTERPASSISDTAARRRRMNEGADELVPERGSAEPQGGHGAAGIDMGSGGEGTDIK
jgi:hypothetical protein